MDGNNNHCYNIDDHIQRACECSEHKSKESLIGMFGKMEIKEVKDNKSQNNKTGIGLGCRPYGAASRVLFDFIPHRPCHQVLIKKKCPYHYMYNGKGQKAQFRDSY